MSAKYSEMNEMTWEVRNSVSRVFIWQIMDVRNLSVPTSSVDIAIDKVPDYRLQEIDFRELWMLCYAHQGAYGHPQKML